MEIKVTFKYPLLAGVVIAGIPGIGWTVLERFYTETHDGPTIKYACLRNDGNASVVISETLLRLDETKPR